MDAVRPLSIAGWMLLASSSGLVSAQTSTSQTQPPSSSSSAVSLLIRTDDVGMSHSVNMGMQQLVKTGLPVSVSVLFVCPWYQEAVEILKQHPNGITKILP